MMNAKEYANAVANKIREMGTEVTVAPVEKINVTYTGITVRDAESNVSPTIMAEHLMEAKLSVDEAVNEVLRIYAQNRQKSIDAKEVFSWDNVKDKIQLQIINEKAKFDNVPYFTVAGDLIAYPIIVFDEISFGGRSSAKINRNLIKLWDKSEIEVLRTAQQNMLKQQYIIENMAKTMEVMAKEQYLKGEIPEFIYDMMIQQAEMTPMNILSNKERVHGASMLLNTKALDEFYAKNGKFMILPSSIHEVILIPFSDIAEGEERGAQDMVREINASEIAADEFLSDNVFAYDGQSLYQMF